jgi:hypothetical protein
MKFQVVFHEDNKISFFDKENNHVVNAEFVMEKLTHESAKLSNEKENHVVYNDHSLPNLYCTNNYVVEYSGNQPILVSADDLKFWIEATNHALKTAVK